MARAGVAFAAFAPACSEAPSKEQFSDRVSMGFTLEPLSQDYNASIEGRLDIEPTKDGYRAAAGALWRPPGNMTVEMRSDAVVLRGEFLGASGHSDGTSFSDYWTELRLPRRSDGR